MKNVKLRKLTIEEKSMVAAGNIHYSLENHNYYVPNPCPGGRFKNYWRYAAGTVDDMKTIEYKAGRGTNVTSYRTTAEAQAAAAKEAMG